MAANELSLIYEMTVYGRISKTAWNVALYLHINMAHFFLKWTAKTHDIRIFVSSQFSNVPICRQEIIFMFSLTVMLWQISIVRVFPDPSSSVIHCQIMSVFKIINNVKLFQKFNFQAESNFHYLWSRLALAPLYWSLCEFSLIYNIC